MTTVAALLPSSLDAAIAAMLPVAVAPKAVPFAPLTSGQRLVLAEDGVYLEAAHSALYARLRLVGGKFPYGALSESLSLPSGPIPRALYDQLLADSLEAYPNEMAALVIATPDGYALHRPTAKATAGSVRYDDHGYGDHPLVIDAHSHGHHAAYFSRMDDESDRSRTGPYVSVVFGNCSSPERVNACLRVCVAGYLIPLPLPTLRSLFA